MWANRLPFCDNVNEVIFIMHKSVLPNNEIKKYPLANKQQNLDTPVTSWQPAAYCIYVIPPLVHRHISPFLN